MVNILFSASGATPKKQCQLRSTKSPPRRDGRSLFFGRRPDALVHGKQECRDDDHSHSLVALRLVRENPTDSPYTVLCFLRLQVGQRKRTRGGIDRRSIREREVVGLALNRSLS